MRATRLVSAGTAAAVLLLGVAPVALSGEEATGEGRHYLYGEVEGFFHHNEDNPLDCAIGFTSEETANGTSTLLGATTLTARNCYVPTDTYQNMTHGVVTLTGENGDVLELEATTGNCLPDDVSTPGGVYSCLMITDITSGTGGFEGAGGEIVALAYTTNVQADHPDAAPGDTPLRMIFEGLVEY